MLYNLPNVCDPLPRISGCPEIGGRDRFGRAKVPTSTHWTSVLAAVCARVERFDLGTVTIEYVLALDLHGRREKAVFGHEVFFRHDEAFRDLVRAKPAAPLAQLCLE